jgi:hypothetical protein
MFTRNESNFLFRALTLSSCLLTSPFAINGNGENLLQKSPRYKAQLSTLLFGVLAFELLAILLTLPTTMSTKTIPNIIAHGFYIFIRAVYFLAKANLAFYDNEVRELINQTFKMNAGFGSQFLGRMENENRGREVFLIFLLMSSIAVSACFQMLSLLLIFWDLPFTVYPGSESLRGNYCFFILLAVARLEFFFEEVGTILLIVSGTFCMTSTLFWLRRAW